MSDTLTKAQRAFIPIQQKGNLPAAVRLARSVVSGGLLAAALDDDPCSLAGSLAGPFERDPADGVPWADFCAQLMAGDGHRDRATRPSGRLQDGRCAMKAPTTIDVYDALTLEIGRTDALTGLLAQRLTELDGRPDAPSELYALSLLADAVTEKLQLILDNARALHVAVERTGKKGGTR